MNLVQYTERSRKSLGHPGIDVAREVLEDLYEFFNAMDDLEAKWEWLHDPVTNERYQSKSAFKVLNRHTEQRMLTIQLEL